VAEPMKGVRNDARVATAMATRSFVRRGMAPDSGVVRTRPP
jgi:hypothetical protein